jgi:hypothetical protein
MLATFTVNSKLDNGDGTNTTLREAVQEAENNVGADTIQFASSLADETIELTQGHLNISTQVTIQGRDSSGDVLNITIDAEGNCRVINVAAGGSDVVALEDLTLTSGHVDGVGLSGEGGAIRSSGSLTLRDCTITGNQSTGPVTTLTNA